MHEIVINLHMHTRYSDGTGSHRSIVRAALRCGLDAVIVTDHNVWVGGIERYVREENERLLVLTGEEIHDRNRDPQKDHLLVLGVNQELSNHAADTSALLRKVRRLGGLAFAAHPVDPAAPAFREPDISWQDWSHQSLTGIELWNGLSELKRHIPAWFHGLFYAFFPSLVACGPFPETLELWDRLTSQRPTVALGGSDAHALSMRAGPLSRVVFPYVYHFRAVNTHVLLEKALSGDARVDARSIYAALAAGRCFIGYDLPRSTRGFRFFGVARHRKISMGNRALHRGDLTLIVQLPGNAELILLKDGTPIRMLKHGRELTHIAHEPGAYRIEAYRRHLGRRRGWIFSNPIYVE